MNDEKSKNPKAAVDQEISEQILLLATTELHRLEKENDSWRGAYSGMSLADGDIANLKINGVFNLNKAITRNFPKGHWIVYLQPPIPRPGRSTIMVFSKKNLALIYFGSAIDDK